MTATEVEPARDEADEVVAEGTAAAEADGDGDSEVAPADGEQTSKGEADAEGETKDGKKPGRLQQLLLEY
ncbi:MAG: hypothetical protein K0V04_16000, partial [Deltaproteobacteria bacterium]|nr:hypothetical protein [Deltaproteobacteria bacterium]